eukprot:TRINITY_DN9417_c0_g1_i1.p1 TRINITY_DN9417_c0_g1~~TRINITY_DN9417_c0_g1_i1.p1  ORF type:complete len:167 (-),score=29.37 TRINITY_DN9417_c0_g1_i1:114-614(-)
MNQVSEAASFAGLCHLCELNVSFNCLTSLPANIVTCTALRQLHLHHNALVELPRNLSALKHLMTLSLSHNKSLFPRHIVGSHITKTLQDLPSLCCLRLASNGLTVIPDALVAIDALSELNLADNHLTSMPDSVLNMPSLADLNLTGNPIPELMLTVYQAYTSKIRF